MTQRLGGFVWPTAVLVWEWGEGTAGVVARGGAWHMMAAQPVRPVSTGPRVTAEHKNSSFWRVSTCHEHTRRWVGEVTLMGKCPRGKYYFHSIFVAAFAHKHSHTKSAFCYCVAAR